MEKFNLSEKIDVDSNSTAVKVLHFEDVKEFIRLLKEKEYCEYCKELPRHCKCEDGSSNIVLIDDINKLLGDELK